MINFKNDKNVFNFRTAVVIIDEDYVLLHKMMKDDFWALPGGRVEFQETSKEGAIRELKEEIGAVIEIKRTLWHTENFFEYEGYRYHEIGHYYLATLIESMNKDKRKEYRGIEENEELIYRWFPLNSVQELSLFPEFLKDKLNALPLEIEAIVEKC